MAGLTLNIVGAGGYARCVADVALASGIYDRVIFYDRDPEPGASLLGYEVILEARLFDQEDAAHLAVALGDNAVRQRAVDRLHEKRPDFKYPVLIHPKAAVSRFARAGSGSVVMAGAVIGAGAVVGDHVSLYSGAVVEHDCMIENYVTLAPGAVLGGTVRLGERTFIGLGASVSHGRVLGADVIVGANAAVIHDHSGGAVLVGVPARILRQHNTGQKYL